MNFHIEWAYPERVIYEWVSGDLTTEIIDASFPRIIEFHKMGVQPLHTIVDMRGLNLKSLGEAPYLASKIKALPNVKESGWMIVIGAGVLTFSILSAIRQLAGIKIRTADSYLAARKILENNDRNLSPAQWTKNELLAKVDSKNAYNIL
ncbi:hypothetical protein MASR2M15_15340 [Anaerolineales bacterium]